MTARQILTLLFLLTITVCPLTAFLHTHGSEIVETDGSPILLKGVGLGGWLVPEGYMLHIPGYGSPTSIRNKIVDLIGSEATEEFYRLYRKNYVNETDIEQIAAWGFNSIRLPFHYRLISPEPGIFVEEGFLIIDSLLTWCKRNELYLILDMHCGPGGQNPDNISDSPGEAQMWTVESNQDHTVEIWRAIAERYANEEWIGGYDLLNEPVLPSGYNNTHLRKLYIRIRDAVRAVDDKHIIFIEGNWYATDFDLLTPPFDENMVYSFHKYWNEVTHESVQAYLNIRNLYKIPLWLGESGENSNHWFAESVNLMEENDIGWCWWTHKKVATITSPLSSPMSSNYQTILNYWNGIGPRPSQEFAVRALSEMAQNLGIESCEYRPGVIAALFDDAFMVRPEPYTEHVIPGTIPCVDYDLGKNGVAYYDSDYQKVRFDQAQPWNKGWKYRNDGVDIELCQDAQGAPFNVGWIDEGEWLKYSIDALHGGLYDVVFRIASPTSEGQMELSLNGQIITDAISIPATGGWQNWQSLTVDDLYIPEGKHILGLTFPKGGFNINEVRFRPHSNSLYEEVIPFAYVGQNYPNPFNRTTRIPLILAHPMEVRVRLFSIRGDLIKTIIEDKFRAGLTEIVWDGTNFNDKEVASGLYFYQVQIGDRARVKSLVLLK